MPDYTKRKYYQEPEELLLTPEEEEELMDNMAEMGIKPEEIVDAKERIRYEKHLAKNKLQV